MVPEDFEDSAVSDLDENENVFDTPDDDGSGKDTGERKRNAGFAKLRKENAELRQMVEQTKATVGQLEKQTQRTQRVNPGGESIATQRRRYRNDVQRRASNSLEASGEVFDTDEERSTAFAMEVQAIIASDATALATQQAAAERAPRNVSEVLSEFDILNKEENSEVRERIETLPVKDRTDPDKVRSVVHAYIGENYRRFTDRQSEEPGESDQKVAGTSPVSGKHIHGGKVVLSKAAETAANDVRSGARGVRLSKKGNATQKATQPLTAEDIEIIQSQGSSPSDPQAVSEYLKAKQGVAGSVPRG